MLDPLVSVQADNCQYFMDTRQDWLVFASKFPTEIFKGFGKLTKAGEGTRTPDQLITNQLLYQLSYTGFLRTYE